MRPSRIALGLTIAAAITAPFVAGTSRPTANAQTWIALTPEQRAEIAAKLERSGNCRFFETQVEARDVLGLKVDPGDIDDALACHREQDALRDGGKMQANFSLPRYLAVNGAVALASALGMLGLAMVLPALRRRARWRLGS
ncbi:hypothetical protein [Bradyrhizobium sp.]|uniref:hypothetical protein n=1 Tax=Bradyrhizobium sp. TaxID=376 RepID=UPI001D38F87F|nr:hypothetical protein [Bradyrhizobium sp.]MBI5318431.1 hypothetical protein [Bradyrhizobium sp.]